MARPAGVPTRQLGARVPCDLFEAAVWLGEKQGLDISSTIIQALQEWVDAQEEKYCPVCSTVNPRAYRYCRVWRKRRQYESFGVFEMKPWYGGINNHDDHGSYFG